MEMELIFEFSSSISECRRIIVVGIRDDGGNFRAAHLREEEKIKNKQ